MAETSYDPNLELEDLRSRLQEAEETLRAIRHGEVDALVVTEQGSGGEKVYTLKSADRPYRLMIEGMRQGAVTLTRTGVVLYCNACFAGLVKAPLSSLAGSSLLPVLDLASQALFQALLAEGEGQAEVELRASDGVRVPSYLSLTTLPLIDDEEPVLCLVVTDLTEQKRNEQIVADERLTRSILEEVAEAMVVCDRQGRILRTSREIHRLSERHVLYEPFVEAFPLELPRPRVPGRRVLPLPAAGRPPRARAGGEPLRPGAAARPDRLGEPLLGPGAAHRGLRRHLYRHHRAAAGRAGAGARLGCGRGHERGEGPFPGDPQPRAAHAADSGPGHRLQPGGQQRRAPPRLLDDLSMIRRNIELEARLIDDLLDLTRISRGKLELQRQATDLRQVLEHTIRTCCGEHAASGRLSLEVDLASSAGTLWADPSRLTQVFWNLLNNAVKFTPEGGRIQVRSWRDELAPVPPAPPEIIVEVSDTGQGIEEELLPRIFNAFEQGEPNSARQAGLGLGLAISRAIVELHGGEISARSGGSGQGATFTVRLPVGRVPAVSMPATEVPGLEALPASSSQPLRPLHILLVEDHQDTAHALGELLRICGHRVSIAGSVTEALAEVRGPAAQDGARGIDLVISDLGLPDGSGLELMRELSNRHGLRGIALSGYGMEEDVRKSRDAGFLMHITKPVNLQVLEEAILRTTATSEVTAPSRS